MGEVERPAGWYRTKSGQRRYWDGYAWHDAIPTRPGAGAAPTPPMTRSTKRTLWIFIGAAAAFLVVALGVAKLVGGDDEVSASRVISVCQDAVRNQLRDPDSAQFTEWKAWQVRDGLYSAAGLVNAKNGFGGYAGHEPYTCDAELVGDKIRATAINASDVLSP